MYAIVRYSGSARTVVASGFERDDARILASDALDALILICNAIGVRV